MQIVESEENEVQGLAERNAYEKKTQEPKPFTERIISSRLKEVILNWKNMDIW